MKANNLSETVIVLHGRVEVVLSEQAIVYIMVQKDLGIVQSYSFVI